MQALIIFWAFSSKTIILIALSYCFLPAITPAKLYFPFEPTSTSEFLPCSGKE